MDAIVTSRKSFLASHDRMSDQNIVGSVLMMYYADVPKEQHPISFFETVKSNFGDLKMKPPGKKYAAAVFGNTMILNEDKWNAFVANPDAVKLQEDLAFNIAGAFFKNWNTKFLPRFQEFTIKNNDLGRLYLKGIMEMNPTKAKKMYPDATFTMRVSYGNVKSYVPRDAVKYDFVTTSKGLLEKYKAGDYEFDLPGKQIELLKSVTLVNMLIRSVKNW